jgi:predicted Kef-type K+ transport protein
MNWYLTETVIGAIVIGLSAVSLEAIFARYAKIERSSLSAVVCPLIAYILAGVVDGFMSDGDFVAAYFHYLPGLGVILLMMLMIDGLRSWWRSLRQVRRLLNRSSRP